MSNISKRNESLDSLKGIAILLVMFGHVQVHNQMTDPFLYDMIKSLQMPLFFLISGYLCGAGRKVETLAELGRRIGKRAVAYLLPFFSWLVLQHITNVPKALKAVLFQLDYGLWFLMVLFLFTTLAYIAMWVQARVGAEWGFWLVWLLGCMAALLAYLGGVTFLSPSLQITYLPYYTAAYFVGVHPKITRRALPRWRRSSLAWIGGGIFIMMAAALDLVTVTGVDMLAVQTLASFFGCFWLIQIVIDWKLNPIKSRLAWLGQYTLEIYVVHYHFAAILNRSGAIYSFWTFSGLLYSLAAFAVMSVITASLIVVIRKIPVVRLLLFGKKK
ncbi:MAG: acyltransferase family protein [Lachnospiraceae bacterium]|nr:acyltransferase family protein [Lachnospiraceae bacterium]